MTESTRRQFLASSALLVPSPKPASRIANIQHLGPLIRECSLAGERRSDDVVPAHPNGLQLSKDRWLLIYATRTFRGVDDDLSIVYQLRAETLDGSVLKEGFFRRVESNWDPWATARPTTSGNWATRCSSACRRAPAPAESPRLRPTYSWPSGAVPPACSTQRRRCSPASRPATAPRC